MRLTCASWLVQAARSATILCRRARFWAASPLTGPPFFPAARGIEGLSGFYCRIFEGLQPIAVESGHDPRGVLIEHRELFGFLGRCGGDLLLELLAYRSYLGLQFLAYGRFDLLIGLEGALRRVAQRVE